MATQWYARIETALIEIAISLFLKKQSQRDIMKNAPMIRLALK
jgi:hypothetical protein